MRPAALFLLLAAPLWAQTAADTLGEVTVTAARTAVATHDAPSRVTVLDAADLEAAGARSVADALEARTGVFVKRYGPGGLASLSLRGTGASQTLVLLDGHRIADPQLGQLDLGLLPAGVVDGLEVAHGAASALHGTDGVGGVVHVKTPRPRGRSARLGLRTGAWGERGASVLVSDGEPGWSAVVALDHDESTGDYLYTDSTRFDAETRTLGVTAPRTGADVRRDALFGKLGYDRGGARGTVGVLATDADRGLFSFSGSGGARQRDRALRVWTDHALEAGWWRLRLGGLGQISSLRYQNAAIRLDDTGRTHAGSLRLEAARALEVGPLLADVTVGGEGRAGRAEHPSLASDATETAQAAFASAVLEVGRVTAFPAVRYDRVAAPTGDALEAVSPSLGLNVQPTRWSGLRVKASAGRAFRTPTFNDRFWMPGGDPALRPERGWTADAGVSLIVAGPRARLDLEGGAFASALRDQIVWRPGRFDDGFYWAPVNVGETRTRGLEASARVRWGVVEAGGLATWTDATDRTDPESSAFGQPLLYVPDRLVRADLSLEVAGLRLDAGLEHTGRRATASDGSSSLPPVTVLEGGLSASRTLGPGRATLALRVENLLDARYALVRQYPMPPRHLRVRLTLASL